MDKTAIEQIQKSANIPALLQQVNDRHPEATVAVLPDNFTIADLERYMPYRNSYRASMSTDSMADFVEYASEFQQEGSHCYISTDSMKAEIVFDLGTLGQPGHQRHKASLSLTRTAAYRALMQINGERVDQKKLAEWIEDWAENIKAHDTAGDSMSAKTAAAAIRRMTIEQVRKVESEVQDYSANMSAMERIEAKSKDTMPAGFVFTCTPYNSLGEYSFEVRISVLTGAEKPMLSLRIRQFELAQESMTKEFKELLVSELSGGHIETYIGHLG
ncbi:DUF2303 family protein [Kistimonas asteriae]|uniref:DUF2303 family protein n=1 Tax=Kistimonas asteriae TaxID=517724 RepID=UPI001BAAFCA4